MTLRMRKLILEMTKIKQTEREKMKYKFWNMIMLSMMVTVVVFSGCVSQPQSTASQTNDNIQQTPIQTPYNFDSDSAPATGQSSVVQKDILDPVVIDTTLLISQGWIVKNYPDFYDSFDFLYEPSAKGTIFVNRDDKGNIKEISAVMAKEDFGNKILTVNGITFKNFVGTVAKEKPLSPLAVTVDIDNPKDQNIMVSGSSCKQKEYKYCYSQSGLGNERMVSHSIKSNFIGHFTFLSKYYEEYNHPSFVLYVRFLPTTKKGEKMTITTEWLSPDTEQRIQLQDFAVYIKLDQHKPAGDIFLKSRLEENGAVNLQTINKYKIVISITMKYDDGIVITNGAPRMEPFNLVNAIVGGNELEVARVYPHKMTSWQATLESSPILQN